MDYNKYDSLILSKIEHILDILIAVAIPLILSNAINDYFRNNTIFLYVNSVLCLSLILLTILRKKIGPKSKILIIAAMTFIAGLLSILTAGFAGTGSVTLVLGSVIIVGFSPKKTSIIYASVLVAIIAAFLLMIKYNIIIYDLNDPKFNPNLAQNWVNHIVVFILCLLVIIIVINTMKKYFSISLKETEDHLKYIDNLAYYDQLTGLPNKNKLLGIDEDLFKEASCVVLFSVAGYDLINSIYGTETIDELTVAIRDVLVAKKDYFVSYAKTDVNEFGFVLKKGKEKDLHKIIDSSVAEIQLHNAILKWKRGMKFNIGYYEITDSGSNIKDACQKAKIALQQSKINRSTSPVRYNEKIEMQIREDDRLKQLLEEAVRIDEFTVVYQEKVDSENEKVTGVEALARWQSKELGSVSPVIFIPIIEKSSQFAQFGNLIIKKVLGDYDKLQAKYGQDIKVSINISPPYLLSQDFINTITKEIDFEKIKPENIYFEITEESVIDNLENAIAVIWEVKGYGFKISLDDFGSGYSSFLYLSRLMLDEVKLDKTFIEHITTDPKVQRIIEAIVLLKETYDFHIVAEGVETEEQYKILKSIGRFWIQGYYFSKPKSIE